MSDTLHVCAAQNKRFWEIDGNQSLVTEPCIQKTMYPRMTSPIPCSLWEIQHHTQRGTVWSGNTNGDRHGSCSVDSQWGDVQMGRVMVDVRVSQQEARLPLVIIRGKGPSLVGRNWLTKLQPGEQDWTFEWPWAWTAPIKVYCHFSGRIRHPGRFQGKDSY